MNLCDSIRLKYVVGCSKNKTFCMGTYWNEKVRITPTQKNLGAPAFTSLSLCVQFAKLPPAWNFLFLLLGVAPKKIQTGSIARHQSLGKSSLHIRAALHVAQKINRVTQLLNPAPTERSHLPQQHRATSSKGGFYRKLVKVQWTVLMVELGLEHIIICLPSCESFIGH